MLLPALSHMNAQQNSGGSAINKGVPSQFSFIINTTHLQVGREVV